MGILYYIFRNRLIRDAWKKRNEFKKGSDLKYAEAMLVLNKKTGIHEKIDELFVELTKIRNEYFDLLDESDSLKRKGDSLYRIMVTKCYGGKAIINWETGEVK